MTVIRKDWNWRIVGNIIVPASGNKSKFKRILKSGEIRPVKFHKGGAKGHYYWKVACTDLCNHLGYKTNSLYVHQLVWLAFKGEIPKGMTIDHIDGNKRNNKLENLELVTQSDNTKRMLSMYRTTAKTRKVRNGKI